MWSLGVILVNLICGRNPWKRASSEDTTFRAFMQDSNFLASILSISSGLNWILQRIFEIDPKRRISLDALRECIVRCPHLGQQAEENAVNGYQTPPYSPVEKAVSPYAQGLQPVPAMDPLPIQQFAPLPFQPAACQPTPPASNHGSPCQSQHTYRVDQPPVAAPCGSFANQMGFIPSLQAWSRCAQFVPQHMGNHGFLRNFATAF